MLRKTCTFFGHRDCPAEIRPLLMRQIDRLISNEGVCRFLVGNQGQFDRYVQRALSDIQILHPQIRCEVVLAYMQEKVIASTLQTVFPEGLERVPPRYAISRRNRWMLAQSEYVVAYIAHSWGGAAYSVNMARRQGETVINLYQDKEKSGT